MDRRSTSPPKQDVRRVIAVRAHLKPFFPGLVSDIDVRSVEAYKALRMAKGISSWTMNNELKVLSCILKFGVENKYLEEIPRIRRVKIQKKSPRFLSAEEIGKVIAAARPDVRPMLQFMIFTGLRKGEVRHLEWSDVDFEHRLLHVRPKETWSPKTESSARTVPLCDPALEALQMAWERVGEAIGEKLAGLSGEERPLERCPGKSKRCLQTRRCPPHSRSWASPHLRVADGHGRGRSLRHHEGDGAHRHQDDDDLRVPGKEPHPGAGREAQHHSLAPAYQLNKYEHCLLKHRAFGCTRHAAHGADRISLTNAAMICALCFVLSIFIAISP